MKRFSILIQLRFIYIYMLIYIVVGYFYESYLKKIGVYSFLETYFGLTFFFILLLVLLNFYSYFIRCSKKRMVYSTRVFFLSVLIISSVVLWFMYSLNIPFKKELANDELLKRSIEMIFYERKFGLIATFLFNIIITRVQFLHLYITLYILSFISFFFIGAKSIRRIITKIIVTRKLKKKMERDRQALQEQIRLMELMEEKERKMKEEVVDDTSI